MFFKSAHGILLADKGRQLPPDKDFALTAKIKEDAMSKVLLTKLDVDLKLAGYKKRTRQSYVRAVRQLRNFWGCDLEEIEEQQVREYWLHCTDDPCLLHGGLLAWSASW